MAKISLVLIFSLLVALPFRSVLSQDDNSWKDLIGQGSFSQETLDQAKQAFGGSGEATEDASFFDDGEEGSSLADWIDEDSEAAGKMENAPISSVESPVGAPEDLPTDEVYDDEDGSPAEAPYSLEENSPAGSPESLPIEAPELAPTYAPTNAPFEAPANAPTQTPQASSTNAPTEAPELAPTNASTQAPEEGNAPTQAPEEGNAPAEKLEWGSPKSSEDEPDDDENF